MIRYMAFQGQSSDPKAPSYNSEGLPLVPGLIELHERVERRAASAQRTSARSPSARPLGRTAGPPPTPPSPGWVSDESAFAFAADAVLASATGRSSLARPRRPAVGRLEAGIDIPADDLAGRKLGLAAGKNALVARAALLRRHGLR